MRNLVCNDNNCSVELNIDDTNKVTITKDHQINSRLEELNDMLSKQNGLFSKKIIQLNSSMIKIERNYNSLKSYCNDIDKNYYNLKRTQDNLIAHEIVTGSNLLIISRYQNDINRKITFGIRTIYTILKFSIISNIILSSLFLINLILDILGG